MLYREEVRMSIYAWHFKSIVFIAFLQMANFCLFSPAQAASFDCAKAKTRVERLVCADPELSRLDEAMALAYRDALLVWDGKIAGYVKMTQRGWVGARTLLPIGKDMGGVYCTDDAQRFNCLRGLYADRVAVLKSPGFRLGGIYTRGKDFVKVQAVAGGVNFAYAMADVNATQGFTPEGKPIVVTSGQSQVNFILNGEGSEACQLDANFSAEAVVLTQRGPCAGAKLSGRWIRDASRDPDAELF